MPSVASSILNVPASGVREIAEMAMRLQHQGASILRLYFGESNIPTAEYLKRAAQKAMADGHTFYTENAGMLSLREALSRYYIEKHSVTLDPSSEIMVTSSGIQSLYLGIRCVLDPGDEALMLTPQWPNASSISMMSGARVTEVAMVLDASSGGYVIDFDALAAVVTPRTRLLVYTSPSNPLGWVATEEDQERLLQFCRTHGLWLLADEVYERLYYTEQGGKTNPVPPSILRKASPEDAVMVAQSFSKTYSMTGWRLGWLAGRKDLIARAAMMNEYIMSCPAGFTQRAGETALVWGEDHIRQMLAALRGNRDFCAAALRKMPGVTVPKTDGAFYLFPRIAGLDDSLGFCKRLLTELQVGIAPGAAFGAGGEGSLRICYAAERGILEQAMERLSIFLTTR